MAAVLNTSMKQAAVRAVKAGFKNMKGAAYKKKLKYVVCLWHLDV